MSGDKAGGEPEARLAEARAWLERLAAPDNDLVRQADFTAWVLSSPENQAALRTVSRSLPGWDEAGAHPLERTVATPRDASAPPTTIGEADMAIARRWAQWLAEEGPSPAYFDALRVWLRQDRSRRAAYSVALEELVRPKGGGSDEPPVGEAG